MGKLARLQSIDMLRGFVIALMALDHVRDYFSPMLFDALDLTATTPGWFATRWITHLCATTFVLLAGSSAFLRGHAQGLPALSRYLATRGLMLLALEATWISFSWQFGFDVLILQVIWALGMGMLLLALLVWLPRPAVIVIAAVLMLTHDLLDGVHLNGLLWMLWHQRGFYPLGAGHGIVVMYPLMPWLGLIAAGYALGPVFLQAPARRQRFFLAAAGVLLLSFIALRSENFYGDMQTWSQQARGWEFTLMSFIDVSKYPPSLLYLCVTLAIGLVLLALFDRLQRPLPVLSLFGRTPMFFYVVHIALVHLLGNTYLMLRYGALPTFANGTGKLPPGYQPSLLACYVAWLSVLALMYGLTLLWCRWRAGRAAAVAAANPG